jgi:hypothetical protein
MHMEGLVGTMIKKIGATNSTPVKDLIQQSSVKHVPSKHFLKCG